MTLEEHIRLAVGIVLENSTPEAFIGLSTVSPKEKLTMARCLARMLSTDLSFKPSTGCMYFHLQEDYQSCVDKAILYCEGVSRHGFMSEFKSAKIIVGSMNRILSDRTADCAFQYTFACVCHSYTQAWGRFSHDE